MNALRRERNEKRLAKLQILLPEVEESTEDVSTVPIRQKSLEPVEASTIETPVEASTETPVEAAIEAPLFDNTLVKTGEMSFALLTLTFDSANFSYIEKGT